MSIRAIQESWGRSFTGVGCERERGHPLIIRWTAINLSEILREHNFGCVGNGMPINAAGSAGAHFLGHPSRAGVAPSIIYKPRRRKQGEVACGETTIPKAGQFGEESHTHGRQVPKIKSEKGNAKRIQGQQCRPKEASRSGGQAGCHQKEIGPRFAVSLGARTRVDSLVSVAGSYSAVAAGRRFKKTMREIPVINGGLRRSLIAGSSSLLPATSCRPVKNHLPPSSRRT